MNKIEDVRVSLSLHDMNGQKLCDQYDSYIMAPGQAHTIIRTTELNGWKELSFQLPYMVDNKTNFRWKYIRNEYKLRVREGKDEDWFTISSPKKTRGSGKLSNHVTCYHISSVLKTKNLYLEFTDDNGIGTCDELVERALVNTGWSLGLCDTFFEQDGATEKIRSLSSSGKVGSYQLITNICGLFNAYPTYNGATKTVDIHALRDKKPLKEMIVGKTLSALTATYNSDNIVTRLYVEGEYGDDGYVGIDSVNPTGLSYLLNFDYYKQIGMFSPSHQAALDKYLAGMKACVGAISGEAKLILEKENRLNELWGQPGYIVYDVVNGAPIERCCSDNVPDAKKAVTVGTTIYEYGANRLVPKTVTEGYYFSMPFVKFLNPTSGLIGAKETAIEAKQTMISSLQADLDKTKDDAEKTTLQEKIDQLETEVSDIYHGTEEAEGLYPLTDEAYKLAVEIGSLYLSQSSSKNQQLLLESEFVAAMGDMLRDGYWSNTNYISGQEQFLYNDAVEMMAELSKPQVSYTITLAHATDIYGIIQVSYLLNSKVRIYDPELEVNDIVFVNKLVDHLDDRSKSTVEISNDDLSIVGKSFDSILSRITLIADLLEQKKSMYERASSIGSDGNIPIERLNGTIDVLRNRQLSTTSSWYTDDAGNIIFQAVNGKSAMMLTGEGFMIASGKTDDGEWNWRTFGTGEGFTADLIVTGFLSADRIEANSIGLGHLTSELGKQIEKAANIEIDIDSITSSVTSAIGAGVHVSATEPENPTDGMMWLDTSVTPNLLKRREGGQIDDYGNVVEAGWAIVNDTVALNERVKRAEQKITDRAIISTVTSSAAYKDGQNEMKQSAVQQTTDAFNIKFQDVTTTAATAHYLANTVHKNMNTWFSFSSDGLKIGKDGSPFSTKQDNEEYAFYYEGDKVAYMKGSILNIPKAYARNVLRIGGLEGVVDSSGNISWVWVGIDDDE